MRFFKVYSSKQSWF